MQKFKSVLSVIERLALRALIGAAVGAAAAYITVQVLSLVSAKPQAPQVAEASKE
jgi:hypothetical protein